MTRRDEVIMMAEDAGLDAEWIADCAGELAALKRFADMVAAAKQEQCAKAVDGEALAGPTDSDGDIAYGNAIRHAAKAVRALKDEVGG